MQTNPQKPVTVLIADESARARRGLRALLKAQTAIDVIGEAQRGDETLSLLEALQPSVVLLDVQAPRMDGIRTIQTAKARWPKIRAIALGLYADHRAEALAAGADAFLIKGSSPHELIAAITKRRTV